MEGYVSLTESNLRKEAIVKLANNFSRVFSFEVGGDIYKVVNDMGGSVDISKDYFSSESSGTLIIESGGRFSIKIPETSSLERNRFTIAHEIGHYVLHYLLKSLDREQKYYATRCGSHRVEWEANWFAAELLMPKDEFVKRCQEGMNDEQLSLLFKVSESACGVRRSSLGLE